MLGVLKVLALEKRGENHKGLELARAVEYEDTKLALLVKAVLVGYGHDAAAVKSAVHGRAYPYFLELVLNAVDGDSGINRLEVEQKSLYRDGGVVYGLIALCFKLVANLAAIAVDTEADAIYKCGLLAVDLDGGKILYILGDLNKLREAVVDVSQKVIAAADSVVEHLAVKILVLDLINEVIQGAVAAADDNIIAILNRVKKAGISVLGGNINNDRGIEFLAELVDILKCLTVTCELVVKNVLFVHVAFSIK